MRAVSTAWSKHHMFPAYFIDRGTPYFWQDLGLYQRVLGEQRKENNKAFVQEQKLQSSDATLGPPRYFYYSDRTDVAMQH